MKRVKLCVITPAHWSAFMGGAQYQAKCIIDALAQTDRYEISYLANRVDPAFHPTDHAVIPIGGRVPRLGYLMHTRQMLATLRRVAPDVIYQRVACGYTGIAAHYARRHGARMVWHVAHDGDVAPGRLEYGRNPLRNFLELRSVEYGIRHANAIITQTRYQAELLYANYGRRADATVPNFHPLPEEHLDKSGPITVVWVANIKRWKQPQVFVRLAESLADIPDVRFVMVGAPPPADSDSDWYTELTGQIARSPNLMFMGQRPQEEVNALLSNSHVFVNTSLHEGFANTFIQAWMREVPVVSLHVNPDGVFDQSRVGFHAATEARLQELVRTLIMNRAMREQLGSQAAEYARAHHSIANIGALESVIADAPVIP